MAAVAALPQESKAYMKQVKLALAMLGLGVGLASVQSAYGVGLCEETLAERTSLAGQPSASLEKVLRDPERIDIPLLCRLLANGASTEGLSGHAVDAAFRAPDRRVALILIENGLLREPVPDGNELIKSFPRNFLRFAVSAGRTDLLPLMVAQGKDPNRREKMPNETVQPNAVELAIALGKMEAFKVLLAHGGVIDTTTDQSWGTALDMAVASLDADILRLVSKDFSLSLKPVCLKANGQLARVVLEAPADYWKLLREQGLASDRACSGLQERLVLHLAESRNVLLEGWMGQNLVERLPQLGIRREGFSSGTWKAVGASKNDALPGLLAKAGWKTPALPGLSDETAQKNKAADRALQAKLPGHYYLSGRGEVGAEILLRPNGKFEYAMSYGAVDEFAQGSWKVWNQQVMFRSDSVPRRAASLRASTDAPVVAVPPGQVLVDLRYQGSSVPDFHVMLLGDAPTKAEGYTGEQGWRASFNGPVRKIAMSHPEVDDGKWLVHEVAAGEARRSTYQFDFEPPAPAPKAFNYTLEVRDGNLVLEGSGRPMEFQKH